MYSPKALAQKRRKKILTVVLVIVVCIVNFAPAAVRGIYKIENVFDEMYYSGYGDIGYFGFFPWGSGITGCTYSTVKVFEQRGGWSDVSDETTIEDFGYYSRNYKESKLNERESISIYFFLEKQIIQYWFCVRGTQIKEGTFAPSISWNYTYYVDKKTMYINGPILNFSIEQEHFHTTDTEQIASFLQENGYDKTAEEYEHYFLYDKIIHDWTLGNLFRSRYTTWWIGSAKFVDGPPPEQTA